MKRFLSISILMAVASCMLQSCGEGIITEPKAGEGVVLNVSATAVTVKSGSGETDNLINSVYYFIYKDGDVTGAPVLKGYFSGLNVTDSKTWNIPVSAAQIQELFPAGNGKCRALVVANPPADIANLLATASTGDLSLQYVRSLSFVSTLKGTQANFVMVFDNDVDYTSGTPLTIDASLSRLANKITLKAEVIREKVDPETGILWTSSAEDAKACFYYGVNKTNLAGDFDAVKDGLARSNHFISDEAGFDPASKTEVWHYVEMDESSIPESDRPSGVVSSVPEHPASTDPAYIKCADKYYMLSSFDAIECVAAFYSYPMKWIFNDKYEPYIFIELPWVNTVTSKFTPVYYKIMFSSMSMGRNSWYDVTVKLDVLGSFEKVNPAEDYLHEEYLVKNWANAWDEEEDHENVQADILESRYIVIDKSQYVLNNQTFASIPFTSSHSCDFEIVDAYQYNYKAAKPDKTDKKSAAAGWVTMNGSTIEFSHTLNNDLSSGDLDCAPYVVEVKLYHKDNPAYYHLVTITQYPSMYIKTQLNSDVNPTSLAYGSHRGYTYVNGAQGSGYQNVPESYGSAAGIEQCNMSVVTVTQFDESTGFQIGDPRRNTPLTFEEWTDIKRNISNSDFATVQYLENGRLVATPRRQLRNYYPTRDDANDIVAPKLRLCSGYAANGGNRSYNNNLLRCATYQEDGYPAGRWRLPTAAEIQYIRMLANHNLILSPFANGTSYWCAGGYVDGSGNIVYNTSGNNSSRCVYDEWYWEVIDNAPADDDTWRPIGRAGTDDLTKFTWGDQER